MKLNEVYKILAILSSEFGERFKVDDEKAEVWHQILAHATYEQARDAVMEYIGSDVEFPPIVGQINKIILKDKTGVVKLDWATEWVKVEKAAANSSYNAESEAAKLNPETLKAAGGVAGLREMAQSGPERMATIRAQFRQRFEMLTAKTVQGAIRDTIKTGPVNALGLPNVGRSKELRAK